MTRGLQEPGPIFNGSVLTNSGFPGGSVAKNIPGNAGNVGSIPGLGRSLGGGHGNNSNILAWRIPMDRGA